MPQDQDKAEPGRLIADPVCRREINVNRSKWARWETTLKGFPGRVTICGHNYRRSLEWTAFRDALVAAGDGSAPHRPHRTEAAS